MGRTGDDDCSLQPEDNGSDSLVCGGSKSEGRKLFKVPGGVLGVCGEYIAAMRFVEWLQDGQVERAPAMAAVEALLLNDAGIWHYYYSPVCTRVENKEFAIGSGAGEARAAMAAGAPPKLAVAITATIDPSTGGRVRTMSLRQRRG